MLGFGKKKTPANANNVNSVITTQDTDVDKEEDKFIPNVPRFTIDDLTYYNSRPKLFYGFCRVKPK